MSIKSNIMASPPSASTITITATTGCHLLKVEGYSHSRLFGDGECLKSAEFKAAGHTWCILIYPNGKFSIEGGAVLLYLKLVGRSKNVTAEVQFCLLDRYNADGQALPHNYPKIIHTFKSARHNNKCGFNWFEMPRYNYIEHDDVKEAEKPQYKYIERDGDSIIIRCDIKVLNKPVIHSHGLENLGLIYHCKDDTCKRLYDTWPATSTEPSVNSKGVFTRLFSCFLA